MAIVHRLVAALFTGLVIAASSAPPPPPPAPPPMTTAEITPPPAPSASATAPAPNEPSTPPPPADPHRHVEGSTRGTIACDGKRCIAGKQACAYTAKGWACVAQPTTEQVASTYVCDDGTDCPQGKTCCRSFASAYEYYVCTTRDFDCSIEVCAPGGARCPAGQSCQDGFCKPTAPPLPTCEAQGKKCPADKPICALESGKAACVSSDNAERLREKREAGADVSLLRCLQNADCGAGFHCCTGGAMGTRESFCTLNCDMANTAQYCSTNADCPHTPSLNLVCRPIGNGFPTWGKTCQSP